MIHDEIYLDNAATTPVYPEAADAACRAMLSCYGNPSSLHSKGLQAERIVKEARAKLAAALEVTPADVIFTSGGTEGNNLCVKGGARARARRGDHLITSAIEHSSVLNAFRDLADEGLRVARVPVDRTGLIDPEAVARAVTDETILVSIMAVNNEIGSLQPIAAISQAVKGVNEGILFHVDGVQAFAKVPLSPKRQGIDLLTLSGHKLHAPKGVGAVYIRKGVRLDPLFGRGEHERGLRSGTENVPGIAGLGAAVEIAWSDREALETRLRRLRWLLTERLLRVEGAGVNGRTDAQSAPHIVNISFPGVRGEVLVHALAARGVYVSTGSACSSKKGEISHVLAALSLPKEALESSVRISLSALTTEAEVRRAAETICSTVHELRETPA